MVPYGYFHRLAQAQRIRDGPFFRNVGMQPQVSKLARSESQFLGIARNSRMWWVPVAGCNVSTTAAWQQCCARASLK